MAVNKLGPQLMLFGKYVYEQNQNIWLSFTFIIMNKHKSHLHVNILITEEFESRTSIYLCQNLS